MTLTIRVAEPTDAAELSAFAAAAFRDTFAAQNEPAELEKYLKEAFSEARQSSEILDPHGVVLLAEDEADISGRRIIGYAHLVLGDTPAAVTGPAPIELKRLYVGREWQGRGVAQALMEAALNAARARGAQTVWLGVWERNPRAVSFYTKFGFVRAGEHTFMLGDEPQTDWILTRSTE
jgi:GNAT superfamily N-acetyltransferase